jgi:hypothetical protein
MAPIAHLMLHLSRRACAHTATCVIQVPVLKKRKPSRERAGKGRGKEKGKAKGSEG